MTDLTLADLPGRDTAATGGAGLLDLDRSGGRARPSATRSITWSQKGSCRPATLRRFGRDFPPIRKPGLFPAHEVPGRPRISPG